VIALLQRVRQAQVAVAGDMIASIGPGLLALIGVQREDTEPSARRLAERILGYRMFADDHGRMNRSLLDCGGGLLLVPQFTLAADTHKGTRASFSSAADPEQAQRLFEHLAAVAGERLADVQRGRFGAEMDVSLVNHGPVTFWLDA
jgi:D-tyrosyl-tRNA(Tyr) deacylase